MRITVLTPTLNPGAALQAALASVQAQRHPAHEHLVVDGGSTDGTRKALAAVPGVRVLNCARPGVYAALNAGLQAATGDWIYVLGADDRLHDPDVFPDVAATAGSDAAPDVIYGDVLSERLGGRYGGRFDLERLYGWNICHQALFVHRRVFQRVGPFDERYSAQADWEHNLRWMAHPEVSSRWIDRVIAFYADEGISSTQGDSEFQRDKRFLYLKRAHARLRWPRACSLAGKELVQSAFSGDGERFRRMAKLFPRIVARQA